MDIGTEKPPYVVEPLVDPVPREWDDEPAPPERVPEPLPEPVRVPEKVPA